MKMNMSPGFAHLSFMPQSVWRRTTVVGLTSLLLCELVMTPATRAQDSPQVAAATTDDVVDIGSRRELWVDRELVASIDPEVSFEVQQPEAREVVLVTDQPWEGNTSAYYTLFADTNDQGEPLFRMYYRGSHWDEHAKKATHPEVVCYAESSDGVHWQKPNLGLHAWQGSTDNNIVWDGVGSHCFTPFKDANPRCPPESRYKAISANFAKGQKGLVAFRSPDGLHWSLIQEQPVITEGYFDSQNLAFWDPYTGHYVDYHRTFVDGVRSIMTCTSDDFLTWTKPSLLEFPDAPNQQLYTNAIRPYFRAPHIRIGFPTRFIPQGQHVEPLFMSSRDGKSFTRYNEPVIPQSAPQDRDGNRSNYLANGLLALPEHENELAVYGTEAYYTGPDSRLRRFTYRVDGFVSLHGSSTGGDVVTKPLKFDGEQLELNVAVPPNGFVGIELMDASQQPIEGFTLADCQPIEGDFIAKRVAWKAGRSLSSLSEQAIRLHLVIRDADVFSFRFVEQP